MHKQQRFAVISAAAIAGSVVPRWTNDHGVSGSNPGVSGSNPSGAPFDILHFVRNLSFPLLKNFKSVVDDWGHRLCFFHVSRRCYAW